MPPSAVAAGATATTPFRLLAACRRRTAAPSPCAGPAILAQLLEPAGVDPQLGIDNPCAINAVDTGLRVQPAEPLRRLRRWPRRRGRDDGERVRPRRREQSLWRVRQGRLLLVFG